MQAVGVALGPLLHRCQSCDWGWMDRGFASALAWNMGAFRRNPVTEVRRDETNDVLA
jgi:hypothetical protein